MEGAWFPQVGHYIVINKSERNKVSGIFFSKKKVSKHSDLGRRIIQYVKGKALKPEVELDLSELTDFQKEIYALVCKIPRGRTTTYGSLAYLAGKPGASRAVGQAMATNPFVILIPCHRVISDKSLGGYRWGEPIKKILLDLEGGELF